MNILQWNSFRGLTVLFSFLSEVAFGYKGLKILLYYIAGNLSTLFRIEYTSKVNEKFDCVEVKTEPDLYLLGTLYGDKPSRATYCPSKHVILKIKLPIVLTWKKNIELIYMFSHCSFFWLYYCHQNCTKWKKKVYFHASCLQES